MCWCYVVVSGCHTAPAKPCINIRNMLSIKQLNNKASGIKLVSLYSTIKMMHGPRNIRFNHRAQYRKGELTCPMCAENHSLWECKASKERHKCINCTNFNKYNHKSPINAKHSSLDNSCSCYQNMLRRFTETIDY